MKCTCGYTRFSERRSATTTESEYWIQYSSTRPQGGLGSTPLGGPYLGGVEDSPVVLWAKIPLSSTTTSSGLYCERCSRMRSMKILGGMALVGSYLDGDNIVVVSSAVGDVGCYAVEYRGAETYSYAVKRLIGTPQALNVGVPIDFATPSPPPGEARADFLMRAPVPTDVATTGTYAIILIDRCAGTETSLGTIFLESEPMLIPVSDAVLDAPRLWLQAPGLTAEHIDTTFIRAPGVETLPFEKCDAVIEYDARLGSLPSAQGWTRAFPASGQFSVANGVLQQNRVSGSNDFFYAETVLAAAPDQVHGYVLGRAADGVQLGFMGLAEAAGNNARGFRTELEGSAGTTQLHHDLLAGGAAAVDSTTHRGWVRAGYSYDLGSGACEGASDSLGFRLTAPQGTFPGPGNPVPNVDHRIEAHLGKLTTDVGLTWARYACVSTPGRFIRPYFRGYSQVQSPVLRLYVYAEPYSGTASVRFLVRYDSGSLDPRSRPTKTVSATVATPTPGQIYEVALTLTDAGAGPVWFSVERDWSHGDDLLESAAHLTQIVLRAA